MSFDIRLRFWSCCQLLYGLVSARLDSHYRAIRRQVSKDPVLSDLEEYDPMERIVRRELLRDTIARGHLSSRCFESLWKDFRTLRDPETLASDDWLVQVARTQLKRQIEDGPALSGFLRGYLRAQIAHLERCPACRVKVCAIVREDVRTAGWLKGLMNDGYDGYKEPSDHTRD